jgi:hypothetical protein
MRNRLIVVAACLATFVPAQAAHATTSVFFAFHRSTNANSLLTVNRQDVYTGQILNQLSLRAGSGTSTDECWVSHGWLPTGWYNIVGHFDNYNGSAIKGRVWQLSDKRCNGGTGTLRTELFVHSEEWSDGGQYCPTAGDDPFCWEGTFDYYSEGCIKLAHATPYPSDIARADNFWDAYDGRHGYFNGATLLFVS